MPLLIGRLLLVLLASASFLLTARFVRAGLSPDHRDTAAEKFAHLARAGDPYTALFFGSSAILHGVDPKTVDKVVQTVEPEFRSFNAGVAAMRSFEADKFIREVLSLPGVRPRWIFVEPSLWISDVAPDYREIARTHDWHDLRQSFAATAVAMEVDRPPDPERPDFVRFHLRKCMHRLGNYGQFHRLWATLRGKFRQPYFKADALASGRGYISIERLTDRVGVQSSRRLLDNLDEYHTRVGWLETRNASGVDGAALDCHRRQRRWIEGQGIELIYLMPPYYNDGTVAGWLHEQGEAPRMLDFVKPSLYPELYEIEHRFDPNHLNIPGAQIFSRKIGEQLVEMLTQEKGKSE